MMQMKNKIKQHIRIRNQNPKSIPVYICGNYYHESIKTNELELYGEDVTHLIVTYKVTHLIVTLSRHWSRSSSTGARIILN